jgi:hypothetical protein
MTRSVETDALGRIELSDMPEGTYFALYDSGLSDFDQAMDRWRGETLRFGDRECLSDFLGIDLDNEEPTRTTYLPKSATKKHPAHFPQLSPAR